MLKRKIRKILSIDDIGKSKPVQDKNTVQAEDSFTADLDANLKILREEFSLCSDIIFRELTMNLGSRLRVVLVYFGVLVDLGENHEFFLQSFVWGGAGNSGTGNSGTQNSGEGQTQGDDTIQILLDSLPKTRVVTTSKANEAIDAVAGGEILVLMEGSATAVLVSAQGIPGRAVEEPVIEPSVRGPRDGFVENINTNLALIRQRIKSPNLKSEVVILGKLSKTRIIVCYIKGLASDKIIGEVKARLEKVKVDYIQASGDIEEYLEDETFTVFPLVQNTERPDRVTAALFEGRVAVLVDATPMAIIVPVTFIALLQAGEDYYHRAVFATFVRFLRFIALNIALLLPGMYVAIITFHWELLPPPLLSSVVAYRAGVPFPAYSEAMFMELTFELLREAGLRLPRTIGQAISTVGGLVIGQAAVSAGIVSQGIIMVVALTAIASFTIPNYEAGFSIRLLRFFFIALGAILGVPGIMFGLMLVLAHLCDLRSFGVPYLSPFAPLSARDLKDTFVRVPWWAMGTRPRMFGANKPIRSQGEVEPHKPGEGDTNGS